MIAEKMVDLGTRRSCIRELFEYGREVRAKEGDDAVFDFSLGNPSTPPPDSLNRALNDILTNDKPTLIHGYTSAPGADETRRAIADDLNRRYRADIHPQHIYVTCGAAASLCITLRALAASPVDEILVPSPFFPEYRVFVEGASAIFRNIKPSPGFGLDIVSIESMLNRNVKALILNSPNNPSGVIYSEEELSSLAALLCSKQEEYGHPIYLISDEPYREISYGRAVPFLPLLYDNTIVCYSYSKSLSLPGERIGYIALPSRMEDVDRVFAAVCGAGRSLGYVCAPSLFQKAIAACPSALSDFSVYRANRDRLFSALTSYGYDCVRPDGAFYLFVRSPDGSAASFSEKAKKKNLLLVPGDDFGCPDYLRISYCVAPEVIERALPVFAALIEKKDD